MPAEPMSSGIWRLHFRTAAGARSQRAAIEALTALGVDVLDIDVDVRSGGEEVIAATVRLPAWLDVPALEPALLRIGAEHVRAQPTQPTPR